MITLGSHISATGGLEKVFKRAESIGATVLQIFTKSNRTWFEKPLSQESIDAFKLAWKNSSIKEVVVHAAYLINIASSVQEIAEKSEKSLALELARCEELGIRYLVLHPGSYTSATEQDGLENIIKTLDKILEKSNGTTMILLETMAGQGTTLGTSFEQLAFLREKSKHKKLLGVCFDTCHIFAAGYAFSSEKEYEKTLKTFNDSIGLEHLKVFHLNDSTHPCNSRKDRHAPLGNGHIPLDIFRLIMQDKRFSTIPKILETPADETMALYAQEITLLKSFV